MADNEELNEKKCSWGEGVSIRPDGVNELDPCIYRVEEEYQNVTVRVLRCIRCGHVEIEWEEQPNTIHISSEVDNDE